MGRHLEQGDGADPGHAGQSNWITQATHQAVIVELHTGDAGRLMKHAATHSCTGHA